MRTCYVSAPFGVKEVLHAAGHRVAVDFDRIYREAILPAVSEAGLAGIRGDEFEMRGVVLRSVLAGVLGSEVMIADLTGGSPSVLYELGVRHALRRDVTVVIQAAGTAVPYYLANHRILVYDLGADGTLDGDAAERLRWMLGSVLRSSRAGVACDSPIYEYFPDLRVDVPEEAAAGIRPSYPRRAARMGEVPPPPRGSEDAARAVEEAVRSTPDLAPRAHVDVLRRYRDASAWNDLIRYAEGLPEELALTPEVMQALALALNRRNEPGDQDRAIMLMEHYVSETGGDADSYGILGRIYKDRYVQHRHAGEREAAEHNLAAAIRHYRDGFARHPADYYPGVNLVTLLLQQRTDAARREIEEVLPRVRKAVADKMGGDLAGYWEFATAMELACVARDWAEARSSAERALGTSPPRWMIETSERNLRLIGETLEDPTDLSELHAVADRLREGREAEAQRNA